MDIHGYPSCIKAILGYHLDNEEGDILALFLMGAEKVIVCVAIHKYEIKAAKLCCFVLCYCLHIYAVCCFSIKGISQ